MRQIPGQDLSLEHALATLTDEERADAEQQVRELARADVDRLRTKADRVAERAARLPIGNRKRKKLTEAHELRIQASRLAAAAHLD